MVTSISQGAGINLTRMLHSTDGARQMLQEIRVSLNAKDGITSGYLSLHKGKQGFTLQANSRFNPLGDKAEAAQILKSLIKTAYSAKIDNTGKAHLEAAIDNYLKEKGGKLGTVSFAKLIDTLESVYEESAAGPSDKIQKGGSVRIDAGRMTHTRESISKQERSSLNDYISNRGSYLIRDKATGTVSAAAALDPATVRNGEIRNFLASIMSPEGASANLVNQRRDMQMFLSLESNKALVVEIATRLKANPSALDGILPNQIDTSALKTWITTVATADDGATIKPANSLNFPDDVINSLFSARTAAIQSYNPDFSSITAGLNTGNPIQTNFIKTVIHQYYEKSSDQDKCSILASILRDPGLATEPPGDKRTKMELIALAKGAGAFLQKWLQEYAEKFNDPELSSMLVEAKRGLTPISENIRNSYLAEVIKNSHKPGGRPIAEIREIQNLGAASIAQAFKMDIVYADAPSQPETVVMKLLRPGLAQRAGREEEMMLNIANAHPFAGTATAREFRDYAAAVVGEFSMKDEAANIARASLFNAEGRPVNVETIRQPAQAALLQTEHVLIMSLAGGADVADFAAGLDPQTTGPRPPGFQFSMGPGMINAYINAGLENFLEGLTGTGFFHGDMHTGNVRYTPPPSNAAAGSSGTITMMDWGNAHTLNSDQQSAIVKIYIGLVGADTGYVVEALDGILDAAGKAALTKPAPPNDPPFWVRPTAGQLGFKANGVYTMRDYLQTALMNQVTSMMTNATTGAPETDLDLRVQKTGEILSALRGLLSKNNIPIPAAFANFIKTQNMISQSVDDMRNKHNAQVTLYETVVAPTTERMMTWIRGDQSPALRDALRPLEAKLKADNEKLDDVISEIAGIDDQLLSLGVADAGLAARMDALILEKDQLKIEIAQTEPQIASLKARQTDLRSLQGELAMMGAPNTSASELDERAGRAQAIMLRLGFNATDTQNTIAAFRVRKLAPLGNGVNFYTPLINALLTHKKAKLTLMLGTGLIQATAILSRVNSEREQAVNARRAPVSPRTANQARVLSGQLTPANA